MKFVYPVLNHFSRVHANKKITLRVPLTRLPRKRRAADENGLTKIEMDDTRDVSAVLNRNSVLLRINKVSL